MTNCVSTHDDEMYVTKRDGKTEIVSFDKILQRIKRIGKETNINVNYTALAMKVIDQLFDGISTTKIDELSAEQCASMASIHYDYNTLAGRIIVSNHQKNTCNSFSEVMEQLYGYLDKHGKPSPLVSEELIFVVRENHQILDDLCDYSRDYLIDYFGFKTLDRAYMMKMDGKTIERPQHMWLRVSIGIHGDDIDKVIETYDFMSQKYFTHATPTLFNSGTPRPQLSSCFLLAMESDSIDGIYNTLKDCALISKLAGGIGLHIHNVRATGSHIRGTNGTSNGIVPMLRVFNNTAKYVDQCVTPETIIYTNEGPIKIESCISGKTKVFNKTGGIETIQNVLEHYYQGQMIIIRTTFSSTPLQITPQHPVYALKMGGSNTEWIDAQDLQLGDRIVYSLPTWEQDVENITEDDCKLYSLLFIYGGINQGKYFINIDKSSDDTICKEQYNFITTYLQTKLVEYKEDDNIKMIEWLPALHLPFRNGDLYDADGKKRIHSRWLLLPKNKTIILYNNLLKNSSHINDTDIKDILQWFAIKVTPDSLYTPIKSIYKTEYSGMLYDLQMEKQHDYLIENGLLHNGGGKRNGSFAIYLEPWHADIEMFLQMRKNHGDEELKARDLFYALWIPDLFMERVKANGKWTLMCPDECPGLSDVYGEEFKTLYESYEQAGRGRITIQARDLWYKVMDAQMETGTPYLLYKDACNHKSNQKNVGTIKSSNLCVAPETLILTNNGNVPIHTLCDQTVSVWNGEEFSDVVVHKTGENQELIEIHTDDGSKLTCTKYHKFYIQNSYSKTSIQEVQAKQLMIGDKIIKCKYPIIDGKKTMNYPYTHGFFCGDGTYSVTNTEPVKCKFKSLEGHFHCKRHIEFETENNKDAIYEDEIYCNGISYLKKPKIYLYDEKKNLLEHIQYRYMTNNNDRINLELPLDLDEKYFVPSYDYSLNSKMIWFSGVCDADGCITNNGPNQQLQIASIHFNFLYDIKLMLQTCGINPKIKKMREAGTSYLPDGKGGYKHYDTKELYRILITSYDLKILIDCGFSPKRLKLNDENLPNRSANKFVSISKIIDNERIDDTYCFTEPKRHMGIFNGIITGQCSEVVQYSDDKETAVCNLASIGLPTFIKNGVFDYKMLHKITKIVTKNLNKIIDVNYYPTEKTRRSNMRHRPIGIGVQGLADVFIILGHPFLSDEAKQINRNIFETMYHAALESSCELSVVEGSYETFEGSPASKGELQFDLWSVDPGTVRYDWAKLKQNIMKNGIRNSLLLAPMPTASTSQILGFNECIEPITSNIYSRRTLAGEFIQANKYLMADLMSLNLWNDKIKNNIIANHGSIQQIVEIPQEIKDKYKTVWEMPMRGLIDMAADRGAFICQSQSLNLWIEDPNYNTLTASAFYSWSKGLKTGIYYLRRRGKHQAQQFTIEPEKASSSGAHEEEDICEMCSA
jgi:ribonucleoside-diphosphate reductase alpha chain